MESVMLEHYYVKPSTIDRIRASWLGSQIDDYAGWMEANGTPRAPSFGGCLDFSALLSSHRREAAQTLLLPLLSSRNLYPNA
jgi:hypothetical protein